MFLQHSSKLGLDNSVICSWWIQSLYLLTCLKATMAPIGSRHTLYQSNMTPLSQEFTISWEALECNTSVLSRSFTGFSLSFLYTCPQKFQNTFTAVKFHLISASALKDLCGTCKLAEISDSFGLKCPPVLCPTWECTAAGRKVEGA